VSRQIANGHVFFNVAGALLFLPAVPLCSVALTWLIPSVSADYAEKRVAEPV
jgi:Na+/phosphate symporter